MATEALGSQIVSASQEGGVNKNNFINSLTQGAFSQLGKVPNTILGLTQGARGASDIAQGNTAQGITELGMGALALKGAKNQKGLFLNKPVVTGSKQIPIPKDYEGKITIPEAKGMAHQKFGLSIFDNQVKPSGSDYSHGYDVNNAQKYDLIRPSIQESAQATNERIASYGKALQDVKDKYGDPRVIDLNAALAATKKKLMGSGKDFNQGSYDAAAKKLIAEMNKFDPTWRTTKSEFTTGWKAKAAAGDLASFERDPLKAGETTPKEKFFNEFYTQLKNQLEENAPPQYKDINKALTDLFPIQKALNRRVPVDVRNNKLSLGDLITGTAALAHPSTIPIFAAMKASKSLPFARFLSNLGPKEQPFIPGAVPDLPQYPQLEANLRNPPQYPRIKDGGIRVAPKAEGPQLTQDQIKARLWQSGTLNLQNTGPSPRFNLPSKASLPGQINLPSPGVLSGQEILRNIINTKAKEVPTKMRFKKK